MISKPQNRNHCFLFAQLIGQFEVMFTNSTNECVLFFIQMAQTPTGCSQLRIMAGYKSEINDTARITIKTSMHANMTDELMFI